MRKTLSLLLLVAACGTNGRQQNNGDLGIPDLSGLGGFDLTGADLRIAGCSSASYQAMQAPVAVLAVLDSSPSMAANSKWAFAAQATIKAFDQDIFDSAYVGLYAAPSGTVAGPQCVFGFPVSCQTPAFPQIDLQLAGTNKSTASSGVRHDIKAWFANTNNGPDGSQGDGSPLYSAIQSSILALQAWPDMGKRVMVVVTDGTISCAQFSSRAGFPDCNVCDHDWEDPNNIVNLLKAANQDPMQPIETFIVGVPGADTFDSTGCMEPPYHMRLALSAMAAAGAPNYIPTNCTGKTFTKNGGDPTVSCHFDMTQGNFSAQTLADNISAIRGKLLGCIFDLPPTDGGLPDPALVNVNYTLNGNVIDLYRRAMNTNMCTSDGCWDYTTDGKVELIGKACDDIKGVTDAAVQIVVGCATKIM